MNDILRFYEEDPIYRKYDFNLVTFSFMYAFSENFLLPFSHDEVVHGKNSANAAILLTELLFGDRRLETLSESEVESVSLLLPTLKLAEKSGSILLLDALTETGLCFSRSEAKQLISGNAISVNGQKVTDLGYEINTLSVLKRGKNKFAFVK